jgi:hypothetical protein
MTVEPAPDRTDWATDPLKNTSYQRYNGPESQARSGVMAWLTESFFIPGLI